tara:strand:+ start:12691 stop:13092 length:402 start_codon:yes stop_codon:yes gene_type:complete
MALNIIEQEQIIRGVVKPPSGMNLQDCVLQASYKFAFDFRASIKDTTGDDPAITYVNKMNVSFDYMMTHQTKISYVFSRALIMILADTVATYASVSGALDSDWSDFIVNNIGESIETASQVLPSEKAAYDAII